MKRIFLPSFVSSDWKQLASRPGRNWKRGHSAEPAASCWEAASDALPAEITKALDASSVPEVQQLKLLAAIPKWQTTLPGASRPSSTDILAIARNDDGLCVISVEARDNEDFGPTVAEKLSERSRQGEESGLKSIQALLSLQALEPEIRCHLLYRAATALCAAREFFASTAVMLIHTFGTRPELRSDFDGFCDAMGARVPGSAVRRAEFFEKPRLVLAWVEGDRRFASPWDTRPAPKGVVTRIIGCCSESVDGNEHTRLWLEPGRR